MVKEKENKNMSLKEKEVLMNGIDYIELDSVGSVLTSENMIFPLDCSEAPETASEAEEMMGVHLYDCTDEWFNSLSSNDLTDLFEFVENSGWATAKSVYNTWKTSKWSKWEEANNCYMNLEVI